MRSTCKTCNEGRHSECDGIARYIDQDGHSSYTCECYCRREINAARARKIKVGQVRRLIRELGCRTPTSWSKR